MINIEKTIKIIFKDKIKNSEFDETYTDENLCEEIKNILTPYIGEKASIEVSVIDDDDLEAIPF